MTLFLLAVLGLPLYAIGGLVIGLARWVRDVRDEWRAMRRGWS